jgi:hypothetical protein
MSVVFDLRHDLTVADAVRSREGRKGRSAPQVSTLQDDDTGRPPELRPEQHLVQAVLHREANVSSRGGKVMPYVPTTAAEIRDAAMILRKNIVTAELHPVPPERGLHTIPAERVEELTMLLVALADRLAFIESRLPANTFAEREG